jgi:hypothetical protein
MMKKISFVLFVLLVTTISNSFAQTAVAAAPATTTAATTTDFFAGKWEVVFIGTPNGDAKLVANLVRKDGQLTGELTDPTGTMTEAIPITSIEETAEKLSFGFAAQGYDLTCELEKVDDNNLKGMLANMFEAKATRVAEK